MHKDAIDGAELERLYPLIPWRTPINVTRTDGLAGYACRLCIALHGLKASELELNLADEDAITEHIAIAHPAPPRR